MNSPWKTDQHSDVGSKAANPIERNSKVLSSAVLFQPWSSGPTFLYILDVSQLQHT